MEPKEKKAFEPTGLVPRSIVRTFERFRQQLLPGSETAAIREYRISRYQVLVSARCLFALLTIPIATNWLVSNWLLSPLIEHFWNTQQNEIFLNSYQEERAFAELEFFSEKLFFESLLNNVGVNTGTAPMTDFIRSSFDPVDKQNQQVATPMWHMSVDFSDNKVSKKKLLFDPTANSQGSTPLSLGDTAFGSYPFGSFASSEVVIASDKVDKEDERVKSLYLHKVLEPTTRLGLEKNKIVNNTSKVVDHDYNILTPFVSLPLWNQGNRTTNKVISPNNRQYAQSKMERNETISNDNKVQFTTHAFGSYPFVSTLSTSFASSEGVIASDKVDKEDNNAIYETEIDSLKIKEKIQKKILELAVYYNQQTILSITNIVGDLISIFTLGCLFIWMKPEITILKSFLIEAIYSLSDTTKSFLLILLTDLLVGFHSPRGWETALELLLKHFGLPENQDFVFLFVATFPVLLDTVFKYWIFRHLNKISPSTVATYHSMIE